MTPDTEERGAVVALWKALLLQGGYSTSKEVVDQLPDDAPKTANSSSALKSMARSGQVRCIPVPDKPGRNQFGITADCKLPQGITVRDLMALGLVKVAP